jgi:hypothetical protein
MDFFSIVQFLSKASDAIKDFIRWQSDAKSKFIAYLLVPCAAVAIAYVASGRPGTLFGSESSISIIRLTSYLDGGKVAKHNGVALLVEPSEFDCKLPLPRATSQRLVSSLLPEEWEHNLDRLAFQGTDVHIQLPLWGVSRPIVILAEGDAAEDLWLGGAKLSVANLQLTAQRSVNLVTWGFVSAVFGLGLGFAADSGAAKDAGREQ